MATYELQAEKRTVTGKKVKRIREAGYVPAEIYGREIDNLSVQVDGKTLSQVLGEAGGTHLIAISVGNEPPIRALARNIQYSILKHDLMHVDFYAVVMTETVNVTVPIHIVGKSPLEEEGGVIMTGLNELEIEALPDRLPESFIVDVSGLESYSDSISVSDLTIPEGVTVHSSMDSMVVTAQPPRALLEEEEEAEAPEGLLLEEGEEGEMEGEAEEDFEE